MITIKRTDLSKYNVNSQYYRAPEFDAVDWKNSYILQGCSAVFGLGILDDSQIISHYLADLIKSPVINLGVPGSGMEIQYLNALDLLEEECRPKGVFIVYPNMDRYTLYNEDQIELVGAWSSPQKLSWMLNNNSRQHNLNLVKGYRALWRLANVPLYEWTHQPSNRDFCKNYITWDRFPDVADDGQHWGVVTSKLVAKILFDQFKKRSTKSTS